MLFLSWLSGSVSTSCYNAWLFLLGLIKEALQRRNGQVCSPVLKKLTDSLPDVVHHSKASATCLKYKRGFERWRCWATTFSEVTVLPASSVYVTLFFLTLIQDSVLCSNFGLHSLRAGGASAAANSHVSDRLFKRHSRWKSEKSKDRYI